MAPISNYRTLFIHSRLPWWYFSGINRMQVVNLDSRATEALPSLPELLDYRSRIQDISSDVNIVRMLRAEYKTISETYRHHLHRWISKY